MSDREETADFQDRVLRELTELGLAFARELKAQVTLVKSVEDAERLTLAFHRATRTARLAMALQAKLARERLELAKLERSDTAQQVKTRRAQIRTVICNEIYTPEAEQEAADALRERLDERLDEEALFETFLQGPVEAAIARLRQELGLYLPCPEQDEGGGEERGLAAREADAIDNELSIAVTNARARCAGWAAERSEERVVEGASPTHSASPQPPCDRDAVNLVHELHEQALIPAARRNSS